MRKKLLILMVISLSVLFAFSGCGTGDKAPEQEQEDPTKAPAEKAELVVYANNQVGEDYLSVMDDFIIGKFNEDHPDINVSLTLNNDPTGLAKQQLAAGAGPDIVLMDGPSSLQLFARAGYLKPLDTYSEQYGWEDTYLDWALDACKREGVLYGLPDSVEGLMGYYNKDLFAEHGWQVPKTYDEMIALCDQIKAEGIYPFAFGCSDFKQANEWWVSYAYNAALGKDEFKKYLTGETNWDTPELRDATQKLADMWRNGCINDNSAVITLDDSHNLLATGQAAMIMEGTWFVTQFVSINPDIQWGSFVLPSWDGNTGGTVPMALGGAEGINVNTKYPDAAAEFLNWIYGPEVGKEMLKLGSFYPIKGLDLSSAEDLDPHIVDAYNALDIALSSGNNGYCAWTYFPPITETYLWSNLDVLYYDQIGIDEFMSDLQGEFEKDVENNSLFNFTE